MKGKQNMNAETQMTRRMFGAMALGAAFLGIGFAGGRGTADTPETIKAKTEQIKAKAKAKEQEIKAKADADKKAAEAWEEAQKDAYKAYEKALEKWEKGEVECQGQLWWRDCTTTPYDTPAPTPPPNPDK